MGTIVNNDAKTIQDKLLAFIVKNYMVELDEIPLDTSLVDEGIIDSVGLVEIASFMEQTFNFTVEDDHMIRDNFGSVLKMVAFIQRETSHE